ncbi:hypothetical protein CVU82_01470 [Candidatus Falkowbacteria bacterium HGW-Falkowbacteria-1]|uniref:GLUG domain-containing protein n=1 Tax=Candidatus Falkowbacteria bacterium HGW-Falkowbacteria-1 TaxID=2013768 RepID=A0A2N2E951_9BACT|nr:MAG: hypothetical protein CVU82_01470 [Candidatus Falkowbacteria bacterium HGW-Falkowbacteria-1]
MIKDKFIILKNKKNLCQKLFGKNFFHAWRNKSFLFGFTFIELLTVVFVFALIGTFVLINTSNSRSKGRDLKKIGEMTGLQMALEDYKNIEGEYPNELIPGEELSGFLSSVIFLSEIPSGIVYKNKSSENTYEIEFETEGQVGDLSKGEKCMTPTGILNSGCPKYIYTIEEIWEMVSNQGYVPVASAEELDALRNSTSQTMGIGTVWEGTYLTGLDKKYIQVEDIDLSVYQSGEGWLPIGDSVNNFVGIFDGNGLYVSNLFINTSLAISALFSYISSSTLTNMVLKDAYIAATVGSVGQRAVLVSYANSSIISNCNVYDSTVLTLRGHSAGFITNVTNCEISNSNCYNLIVSNTGNAWDTGSATGFITNSSGSIIDTCSVQNSIVSTASSRRFIHTSGFVSLNSGTSSISNSFSNATISSFSNADSTSSGFCSRNYATISNSYYSGSITTGLLTVVGGFCATNTGSVNNSYYDSEISGQADTGKGFPRTTKQMQEGYANSMIDGDSMYTAWDNDIWKFGLINKYPELK